MADHPAVPGQAGREPAEEDGRLSVHFRKTANPAGSPRRGFCSRGPTLTAARRTVHLGPATEENLRTALHDILAERNAVRIDASWGVGGSVELETLTVRIGEETIIVEAETFHGITLEGPESLVFDIAAEISRHGGACKP